MKKNAAQIKFMHQNVKKYLIFSVPIPLQQSTRKIGNYSELTGKVK